MRPDRLELARLAFARALALARVRSTRATWARLLAAARNLDAARQERGLRGRGREAAPPSAEGVAPAPGPARVLLLAASSSRGALAAAEATPAPAPARATAPEGRGRWHELAAELERSRTLIDRARVLCEEAQWLREAVRALTVVRGGALDPAR